jgi:hypothetical protein
MTSSPIDVLQKAREELVKARRQIAEVLAQPYGRTRTPEARANFIEVQMVIDSIDKAIADERNLNQPSST